MHTDVAIASRYFPFHRLGLRCNPFRALTQEEWAEIAVLPEAVTSVLRHTAGHLQIIGESGRGKTTTLLGLCTHLQREGRNATYEYLPIGQADFRTSLQAVEVFLLDEAQRLSQDERQRLLTTIAARQSASFHLVVASHEDLTSLFRRHHLPLTTLNLDLRSAHYLPLLLERRLRYFALPDADTPLVSFAPDAIAFLHQTYGTNLRAMEWFLYEVFQRLQGPVPITVEFLRDMSLPIGPLAAP